VALHRPLDSFPIFARFQVQHVVQRVQMKKVVMRAARRARAAIAQIAKTILPLPAAVGQLLTRGIRLSTPAAVEGIS